MNEKITNEKLTFDDAAYAQSIVEKENAYFKKVKPALILSAVACVFSLVLTIPIQSDLIIDSCAIIAVILGVISYVIGDGLFAITSAIKAALKLFIVLFFPLNIIALLFIGITGFMCLLFFPLVFIGYGYFLHKRNLNAANEYLKFCK